jgi:hypothetical protein
MKRREFLALPPALALVDAPEQIEIGDAVVIRYRDDWESPFSWRHRSDPEFRTPEAQASDAAFDEYDAKQFAGEKIDGKTWKALAQARTHHRVYGLANVQGLVIDIEEEMVPHLFGELPPHYQRSLVIDVGGSFIWEIEGSYWGWAERIN